MNKGYLTIEAVLIVLALVILLEMIANVGQQRSSQRYTFLNGPPSCDIECLLSQE